MCVGGCVCVYACGEETKRITEAKDKLNSEREREKERGRNKRQLFCSLAVAAVRRRTGIRDEPRQPCRYTASRPFVIPDLLSHKGLANPSTLTGCVCVRVCARAGSVVTMGL